VAVTDAPADAAHHAPLLLTSSLVRAADTGLHTLKVGYELNRACLGPWPKGVAQSALLAALMG
jgi:hypothetical protein